MAGADCDSLRAALESGEPVTDALRAHAAGCPSCEALLSLDALIARDVSVAGPAITPGDALRAALAADHAPRSPFSTARRIAAPLAFALAFAAGILLVKPRRDLAEQSGATFWASAALWVLLCATGLSALLARGRLGLGVRAVVRWLLVGATAVLFEIAAWTLTRSEPSSLHFEGAPALREHFQCATFGSLLAAGVGFLAFRAARGSAAVSPASAGAAAGAAAGIAAVLSLHVACAFANTVHVGLAHGLPVVLGAAAGALLGRRQLAP